MKADSIVTTRWHADPDFSRVVLGRRELIVRRELAPRAETLVNTLGKLSGETGAGNRGGAFRIRLSDAPEIFARRARRGGLVRFVLKDLYVGKNPRPLKELELTIAAAKRGIAVAEPMGAMIEWAGPALYRGFYLSRALTGMTLWEFVQTDDDATVRSHVLTLARDAIEKMHEAGLFHADLNLHNLMVTKAGESFAVVILDLDKSWLQDAPLSRAMRRANWKRLLRSTHKLDPGGRYLDATALSILDAG
jgi:3-deoxy-D-manno-octulosonic acid kinase